jgi:hypothetical protein
LRISALPSPVLRERPSLPQKPGAGRRSKEVACSGLNPNSESCPGAPADTIARIKELRLARDAAARATPRPAPAKKGRSKKKQKKRPAVALADWLKNRHATS